MTYGTWNNPKEFAFDVMGKNGFNITDDWSIVPSENRSKITIYDTQGQEFTILTYRYDFSGDLAGIEYSIHYRDQNNELVEIFQG
jgi:hypothetical protein